MAFITITPGQTDANSPGDQLLFDTIRENLDDLDSRLSNISQGDLNTATGEVSTSSSVVQNLTLPGGKHGFREQFRETGDGMTAQGAVGQIGSTYITNTAIRSITSGTVYAEQTYIQASPPYKIGNKNWGLFLFILRNISTGEIVASYEAEDPCWAYNGPRHNKKDSIERIQAVPHPFTDYHHTDPAIDGLEIQLIDLSDHNTEDWKKNAEGRGKSILQELNEGDVTFNPEGEIIKPSDIQIAEINGFTDKVKIRKRT